MDFVVVPIRFPKDQYRELKQEAQEKGISFAEVVRQLHKQKDPSIHQNHAKKLLERMNTLSKKITKENKGISLSQAVIDMRYEQ